MIETLRNSITNMRAQRVQHQSRYAAALRDVPPGLFPHWQKTARQEFEGIPADAFFYACALDGLLAFFDCVRNSHRECGLPSKAADSVWHAWIAFAPAGLEQFCIRHFGRAIAHVEAAEMRGDMDQALAACLVQARKIDRYAPAGPNVPRLFGLDIALRMPRGFGYTIAKGKLRFGHLNDAGRLAGPALEALSLAPLALLTTGLISHDTYRMEERRNSFAGDSGSAGASSSGCDAGSSGCDGGGGGGGCGGGGCGGGA